MCQKQRDDSFARLVARLIELGIITIRTEEVELAVITTATSTKEQNHDTPNCDLRQS